MKDSIYTICYAVGVGALCAGLLTGAAQFTAPYQDANRTAERTRNILGVLEVPVEPKTSAEELKALFEKRVREEQVGSMSVFHLLADGQADALVAVAVEGPGLWGPMRGFVSLESDWNTIRGITFHQQEETPGLGAEVAGEAFRSQFRGKRLLADDGTPGLRMVYDGAEGPLQIDGISGATITCNRVGDILTGLAEQVVKKGQTEEQR
ncbi:MAG: FMN-binding protein [Patescibacteria group bacterium]|nr:FMN-binding protein [Patescibacteria group bacterium]